jgi:predicted SnoaL-like aldol condensation-catalyzing enzyme
MQNNKLIGRLWMEFISKGDIEGISAITSSEWTMHGGLSDLPGDHPAKIRKLFSVYGPTGVKWKIEDIIAEDDLVVIRAINLGDDKDEPVFSATFIHRIANGQIQETWRNADDLGRALRAGARIVA